MAIQFRMTPDGISRQPGVKFDITQQEQDKIWRWHKDKPSFDPAVYTPFPSQVEKPNDDIDGPLAMSGSRAPSLKEHMYSSDAPGRGTDQSGPLKAWVMRINLYTWVRVRFDGNRPSDEKVDGSRTSPRFEWHARHWLVDKFGWFERTTGDNPETDENDVAPGHKPLGFSP